MAEEAVIILALVSAGLMMRAYWLQRWFQRRVEEALQTSNLIPINVAAALGLRLPDNGRREKEEKVGIMSTMWEGKWFAAKAR
nr:hypothetical protein L203_00677 [Cryptococcus depauperatus CBS 7841]